MDLLTALAAVSSIALWSCATKPQAIDAPNPSGSEIETALAGKLPMFTRVSSLSVVSASTGEAQQDPATGVLWQARIRATVVLTADTFALETENSETNAGVTFVRSVKRSGETIEIFANIVAKMDSGGWRTIVELEGQPAESLGQPLSAFGPQKVIARGSAEEEQFLADKRNAEIRNAKIRYLEGTISDFECGHACYLTVTDRKGRKITEICDAPLCDEWWTTVGGYMPPRYIGKRVRITVVKKLRVLDVKVMKVLKGTRLSGSSS